jgi:hypothetical protein
MLVVLRRVVVVVTLVIPPQPVRIVVVLVAPGIEPVVRRPVLIDLRRHDFPRNVEHRCGGAQHAVGELSLGLQYLLGVAPTRRG